MTTSHNPGARSRRPQADWAAPHLLTRRSLVGLVLASLLITIGALIDTVTFQNTIELALPPTSQLMAFVMAAGATFLALVSVASQGIALAIYRRGGRSGSWLVIVSAAAVWLGVGLAMFLVRWLDTGATRASNTFGSTSASIHPTPLVALLAVQRLARQNNQQVQKAATAEAMLERARATADLHAAELDREDHRRRAPLGERQALGAEAASYSRVLMAAMLRDPAKTGLTETVPVPQMPILWPGEPGAGPGNSEAERGAA
jgi:hypothetical protein